MLNFVNRKADCTGCGVCMNSCPQKCISMEMDEEGFLYPVASASCIHCGICEKICPIINRQTNKDGEDNIPQVYCGLSKDKKIWQKSSSGGAFTEICRAFGDDETIICGAAWDNFTVKHISVHGVDNIDRLRKSKYISSDLGWVYSEIKTFLLDGKKVIFCGTPCQVDALKGFVGDNKNLLLIDLICHGGGSPKVFLSCIEVMSRQYGQKICSYGFRSKRGAWQTDYLTKIVFENGDVKYLINDQYMQLFLSQKCLRPSCGGNCRYRLLPRQGDLTIADFKGRDEVFPELRGSKYNYSTISFNTVKGLNILKKLQKLMTLYQCSIDDIKKYNPLFYRQTKVSEYRDAFFQDYHDDPGKAINKWTTPFIESRIGIRRKVYDLLPNKLRFIILSRR